MKLISFQKLGENRLSPRLWLESRRLEALGFGVGTPFSIELKANGIRLRPVSDSANHVSKRTSAQQQRPIIDVANRSSLSPLDGFSEIKVIAAYKQIDVKPSIRGFQINRRLGRKLPSPVGSADGGRGFVDTGTGTRNWRWQDCCARIGFQAGGGKST